MVLQTAIREKTGREITHQIANRMNTPGTPERRDDLGALLSYRRAVNALAWPAAVLDLISGQRNAVPTAWNRNYRKEDDKKG
nr:hypothetical protein [Pectobacterium carotovorum]